MQASRDSSLLPLDECGVATHSSSSTTLEFVPLNSRKSSDDTPVGFSQTRGESDASRSQSSQELLEEAEQHSKGRNSSDGEFDACSFRRISASGLGLFPVEFQFLHSLLSPSYERLQEKDAAPINLMSYTNFPPLAERLAERSYSAPRARAGSWAKAHDSIKRQPRKSTSLQQRSLAKRLQQQDENASSKNIARFGLLSSSDEEEEMHERNSVKRSFNAMFQSANIATLLVRTWTATVCGVALLTIDPGASRGTEC